MIRSLTLPHIDKPVSILGLGAGTGVFTPETYDRAAELLDAYLDAGGNCIDTAHIYSFGASEKTLGRWLRERGTRARVVLVDKGCHPVVDPHNLFGKPWEPRVTPEAIRADLSESLERLQTDMIDLYLLHRDDENMPVGELIEALNAEQARGRIHAFGASNWRSHRVAEANAYAEAHRMNGFVISSPQFSLARPERMFFPGTLTASDADRAWHSQHQFPLLAWSALSAGFLRPASSPGGDDPIAQIYATDDNMKRVERARELAARKGVTPVQIALAYVLQQPFPVIALVGPTTGAHLHALMEATNLSLDSGEITYLERG